MDSEESKSGVSPVILQAIRIGALAIILYYCYEIILPFLTPLLGGSIFAIALYPLHARITHWMKGRDNWSAIIITLVTLLTVILPAALFMLSTAGEFKDLATAYKAGKFSIPPPSITVKDWPLIGTKTYAYWSQASSDFQQLVNQHAEEIKNIMIRLFDMLASAGGGLIQLALSIIIGGVLLAYEASAGKFARSFFVSMAGKKGEEMVSVAKATVLNVAKGVIGVSAFQALLAGLGMVIAGVPLAGFWALVCMILAVIQIGVLPVSIGVIIYIWNTSDPLTASLLTVWMLIVGVIDNILKPYLMGKGSSIPMLVVFIGTLGGFIAKGFIGLFTGAIMMSLGYMLLMQWLDDKEPLEKTE